MFAHRWMHGFLIYEFPPIRFVRLWDGFMGERDGFQATVVSVCAAILKHTFSPHVIDFDFMGFQDIIVHLQSECFRPEMWDAAAIEAVLADARQIQRRFLFSWPSSQSTFTTRIKRRWQG
mmetsp:Transcript_33814/g.62793  ORF Transcript_33814/g.62793 Transcript_33814/m.62793 type:complete len:120 (-) Transcript_33814:186-545(-)